MQCQGLTTDGIGPGGYIGTVHLYNVGWCNDMVIVVHRSDDESGHSVVMVRYIVVSVEIAMLGSNFNSGCRIANSML